LNITPIASAPRPDHSKRAPLVPAGRFLPFFLVTALFFLWGIPNNLNDILIRQFMKSFEINRLQAGLVQSAFYLGYFLVAMPAGQLMRKWGYKAGFLMGLGLYGAGCILFWPAALVAQYWFFLTALFIIASGLAFLETAAGSFIVQVGPAETAEQRLNLSQSFNPLGSILALLVGSRFIFSGIELKPAQVAVMQAAGTYQAYLRSETLRVIVPYVGLGAIVLFWAVLIARTPFPHVGLDYTAKEAAGDHGPPLWKRKHFVFAVLAQFLYVGAQIGAWSYMIPYVQTYTKLAERSAGYWLTGTLAVFMVGRFVSTWLLRYIPATVRDRCLASGLAGSGLPGGQQLLHVHDVPYDFRAGHQGAGVANQDGRGADRDGDYRRSRNDAADGQDRRCSRNVFCIPGACWLLCGGRAVCVAWVAAGGWGVG
jgi:FHS family L-fucose permease-like MFS transporter